MMNILGLIIQWLGAACIGIAMLDIFLSWFGIDISSKLGFKRVSDVFPYILGFLGLIIFFVGSFVCGGCEAF